MHRPMPTIAALLFSLALTLLAFSFPVAAQTTTQTTTTTTTTTNIWPPAEPEAVDFRANMKDILFAFDKYEDPTNKATLLADAAYLNAHPNIKIRIDGYADNRGTITYNLALAQKRADIARQDLIKAGISPDRIMSATGWGMLYATCDMDSDQCWDVNRRAHLRYYW